ncbi:MAG: hypothetical protein CK431_05575 [Mycobacterium sp.]|nr:MAG: hypothetical protein CK431_05575 [Mycobacterium sp.]
MPMTSPITAPLTKSPSGRPFASIQMPTSVRLFHTADTELACRQHPDMFFNPHRMRRAVSLCAGCPFRGRCGYNAVATGATHGVWGGMVLPGDYPSKLAPIYARLAEQFEQCRRREVGDVPVAALHNVEDRDSPPATYAGAA